ncbi:MAG: TRAP transporter small permease [Thermovirgaceae bacterium]|nr:TRAP transporter small permease [Thermovirgaceae bacterium]
MVRNLKIIFDKVNLSIAYLSGLGILGMGLMLFYEVVMRYFFHAPTIWTHEISIYMFIWAMFAGTAYTLKEGKHVRIDLLVNLFPKKTQQILDIITGSIALVFSIFVTCQAWGIVVSAFKYGKLSATPLRFPQWIPQTGLLVGFTLLSLQFFILLVEMINRLHKGGEQA